MTRRLLQIALADELRAEIARQHRTLVSVADSTGMPLRTLKRKLSGGSEFRTPELELLADDLDVEVATLYARAHAAIEAAMRRHPAGSALQA
jgi:hypothetical protein